MQQEKVVKKRLNFIDASRAVAILMMLQGHFVYAMLGEQYHNPESAFYNTWKFFRGITAPLFFTVSGMIFVYLLVRHDIPFFQNPRVKKGIRRGFYLIFWGYLLRTNFLAIIFRGKIYDSFWQVDVLHCIGIGILSLVIIFGVKSLIRIIPVSYFYGVTALAIFVLHPMYSEIDYSSLPVFLQNYLTDENGSVFTILPWIGYTMIGGVFGYVFRKHEYYIRTWWFPFCFIGFGFILDRFTGQFFMFLHRLSEWENFKDVAYNTALFVRLGQVFIAIGLFMLGEKIIKKGSELFLRIGRETLLIYQVHYIVLYGSWFGLGISKFWGKSLAPIGVIIGAALFIIAHVLLIRYLDEFNIWIKKFFGVLRHLISSYGKVILAVISDFLKKAFNKKKE